MTTTYSCSSITLTSTTTAVTLQYPQHDGLNHGIDKDIVITDFWSGDFWARDDGLRNQPLELHGVEYATSVDQYVCFPWCFPLCFCEYWLEKFTDVDDMMDRNEEVTLSGLGSPYDAVYVIKNWSYKSTGVPLTYEWKLSLERVRDS